MSDARDAILERIRVSLGPGERPTPPNVAARTAGGDAAGLDGLVERFAERVADYRARVVRVSTATECRAAVADACRRHGAQTLAVPDAVDRAWLSAEIALVSAAAASRDDVAALGLAGGALAVATLAIAETGTIVFDGGPEAGPRALSLVPDVLICIVRVDTIVGGVTEGFAAMAELVRATSRPLTLVSGPSATSDIELERVEGVHGPRQLEVIVLEG